MLPYFAGGRNRGHAEATAVDRSGTFFCIDAHMIELRRDPEARRAPREKRRQAAAVIDDAAAEALFQELRKTRMELARAQGVPPYVIFHDATLVEVAVRRPANLQALANVPGVGAAKLERYGAAILDVVARAEAAGDQVEDGGA